MAENLDQGWQSVLKWLAVLVLVFGYFALVLSLGGTETVEHLFG